jgi:hypothetical protein
MRRGDVGLAVKSAECPESQAKFLEVLAPRFFIAIWSVGCWFTLSNSNARGFWQCSNFTGFTHPTKQTNKQGSDEDSFHLTKLAAAESMDLTMFVISGVLSGPVSGLHVQLVETPVAENHGHFALKKLFPHCVSSQKAAGCVNTGVAHGCGLPFPALF